MIPDLDMDGFGELLEVIADGTEILILAAIGEITENESEVGVAMLFHVTDQSLEPRIALRGVVVQIIDSDELERRLPSFGECVLGSWPKTCGQQGVGSEVM